MELSANILNLITVMSYEPLQYAVFCLLDLESQSLSSLGTGGSMLMTSQDHVTYQAARLVRGMSGVLVFDARKSQLFTHGIRYGLSCRNDKEAIKLTICQGLEVKSTSVHVIENEMTHEAAKRRTVVFVLPEQDYEDVRYLLLETTESVEQKRFLRSVNMHQYMYYRDEDPRGQDSSQLLCGRFRTEMTIQEMNQLINKELGWKSVTVCLNNRVLADEKTIRECGLQNTGQLQVLQLGWQSVKFHYQPRHDTSTVYTLEVDLKKSVGETKHLFEGRFLAEITSDPSQCSYFQIHEQFLEDDSCMGVEIQKLLRDEEIKVQICAKNSIRVNVSFQKPLKQGNKSLIIKKNCSTIELREKIAKTLHESECRGANAVKALLNGKLINEHNDLQEAYPHSWTDGCMISCGIKKPKRLQIKHPQTGQEFKVDMSMLQTVGVLKKKVCKHFGIPELNASLFCQGQKMQSSHLLQYYPVKNNIEIQLELYQHRAAIRVIVVFEKEELLLKVNNVCETTVDDLLRFCAQKLQYNHICSRGLFENRCLNRHQTLLEEGVCTNSKVCYKPV